MPLVVRGGNLPSAGGASGTTFKVGCALAPLGLLVGGRRCNRLPVNADVAVTARAAPTTPADDVGGAVPGMMAPVRGAAKSGPDGGSALSGAARSCTGGLVRPACWCNGSAPTPGPPREPLGRAAKGDPDC